MQFHAIDITMHERVATVTLNRPEVRNAFNDATIAELALAFDELGRDEDVRAIVLAANGAAFCAGGDLNWMKAMAGYSGGMGLVAACDIAVSVDAANFCLSEVKLGLIPATISPYVIKAMGENAARRYFLTAERFTAAEALRIGFVHEMVDAEALDTSVAAIVKSLVSNSPNAVKQAKLLVREMAGRNIDTALLTDSARRIAAIRASDEGREGVASFLEKRKPSWLG